MKVEQQVCSLELAKRLKELGVEQNSYFKYEERECGQVEIYHDKATSCAHKYYCAFTVAELGELLPYELENDFQLISIKFENEWGIDYRNWKSDDVYCFADTSNNSEANARAKMLIWLIENGLIDEKCNAKCKN